MVFTKLSFAEFKRYSSGTERSVDTKLSEAEFTCAPSAELSEAEFLAHVILKGVAFNTLFFL